MSKKREVRLYPARTHYEVRAVLEALDDHKAITTLLSKHDTLNAARNACEKNEFIVKVTRQTVI